MPSQMYQIIYSFISFYVYDIICCNYYMVDRLHLFVYIIISFIFHFFIFFIFYSIRDILISNKLYFYVTNV